MTAHTSFGSQWPASVPRLEVAALDANDLKAIVSRLENIGL